MHQFVPVFVDAGFVVFFFVQHHGWEYNDATPPISGATAFPRMFLLVEVSLLVRMASVQTCPRPLQFGDLAVGQQLGIVEFVDYSLRPFMGFDG